MSLAPRRAMLTSLRAPSRPQSRPILTKGRFCIRGESTPVNTHSSTVPGSCPFRSPPRPKAPLRFREIADQPPAPQTLDLASGERVLRAIRSAVRFRIDELFRENGIVIAFPQRDVHMDTLKPLEVRVLDKEQ